MLTRGRSTRLGGLVLAGLALAGCASQACTAIGCQSSVLVDVGAVQGLGASQAGRVKVCVGSTDTCVLALAPKGQDLVEAVFDAGTLPRAVTDATGPVDVYVSVMNPGTPLVDGKVSTTFTKFAPNGEQCGPVCYSTRVVATNRGLSAVPVRASASPTG